MSDIFKNIDDLELYKNLKIYYKCILKRCNDPNTEYYERYGGRGISVEWDSFEDFYNDVLPRYKVARKRYGDDLEIDRINSNLNYSSDNIRFVPRSVNNINKSNTLYYEYCDQLWTTGMIANYLNAKLGLSESEKFKTYDIGNKIRDGWTIDMIMEIPNRTWSKNDYNYTILPINPIYDVKEIKEAHKLSQGIHPDDFDYLYNNSTSNISKDDAIKIIEDNKKRSPELFPYLKELGKSNTDIN